MSEDVHVGDTWVCVAVRTTAVCHAKVRVIHTTMYEVRTFQFIHSPVEHVSFGNSVIDATPLFF